MNCSASAGLAQAVSLKLPQLTLVLQSCWQREAGREPLQSWGTEAVRSPRGVEEGTRGHLQLFLKGLTPADLAFLLWISQPDLLWDPQKNPGQRGDGEATVRPQCRRWGQRGRPPGRQARRGEHHPLGLGVFLAPFPSQPLPSSAQRRDHWSAACWLGGFPSAPQNPHSTSLWGSYLHHQGGH